MEWGLLALPGLLLWLIILSLPWRPWSTRETLDASPATDPSDLTTITVLVPARDEEAVIARTLQGLMQQSRDIRVMLIDDQSSDQTSAFAKQQDIPGLQIIDGQPLPGGWSGKLWALEQGLQHVDTEVVLLLDADIELLPGTLATLLRKLQNENLAMISLMAQLRMHSNAEKLLIPAFIFFFKLLYPFRLANSTNRLFAAAAGGCILARTDRLREAGAFESLRENLIDDCALARKIKKGGGEIWLGLTHSAISLRAYEKPGEIRDMVARTAFTQLRYSWFLLLLCSILMTIAFVLPLLTLLSGSIWPSISSVATIIIMSICYWPVVHYYSLNPLWIITLPAAGILFLGMTWLSAWRHLVKSGAQWKKRHYSMTALK